MKYSAAIVAAVLAVAANAQDFSKLPSCAQPCPIQAISASGADISDVAKTCTNQKYQDAFTACVQTACTSPADLAATAKWGYDTCLSFGVTITTPEVPGSPATTSSSSSSTPAAVMTTTSTTMTPPPAGGAGGYESTTIVVVTKTSTTCPSSGYPAPTNGTIFTPSAPVATGAAVTMAAKAGAVGLAIAGGIAALL